MKNKVLLLVIGLLISSWELQSQQAIIDSLQQLLKVDQPDSTRAQRIGYLSWESYKVGNIDEALRLADQMIKMADSLMTKDESFWSEQKSYGFSMEGIILINQGNYHDAIEAHQKALAIRKNNKDEGGELSSLLNLGGAYWFLGQYPEAFKNYFDALAIAEKLGSQTSIASITNNIGGVYEHMENFDEALKYYQAALEIQLSHKLKNGLADSYNNIGNIYDYKNKYEESLEYHFKALEMYKADQNKQKTAIVTDNIANTYSHMKDFTKELQYRQVSVKNYEELGDQFGLASSYGNMAGAYLSQKNFQSAIAYFQKSLNLSESIGAKDRIMAAHFGLSEAWAGQKNYKEALAAHQKYAVVRDSMLNEENAQLMADMKEKYESEKKDNQIALLNKNAELDREMHKRKALTRNIMIGSGILLVFLLFSRYRFIHSLQVERIRNRISQDLHDDIGSTLSSISISSTAAGMMKPDRITEIQSTLDHIGQNARAAMENMSDIVWAINPSHDTFKDMMDRLKIFSYKLLDARNIKFNLDIPETLNSIRLTIEQRKNIYLILREAIHNIAKYSDAQECLVAAHFDRRRIYLTVKDNGIGFESITPSLGGNGLRNMKHRAEELQGSFEINSEINKGTTLSIQFAYS